MSEPGALCVGSLSGRRSLCRGPALCVGPALFVSGPGALCRAGAPCVGVLSGSVSGPGALSLCRGPELCAGARRSVCRGRRSLCRGPALSLSVGARRSLCRAPALFVSGPSTLSIGLPRSLSGCVWSPDGSGTGARRSSALSVSGPGALRQSLCVGPRRFVSACVSGPGASVGRNLRRCFCQSSAVSICLYVGPALFVSGPGALCRPHSPARSARKPRAPHCGPQF